MSLAMFAAPFDKVDDVKKQKPVNDKVGSVLSTIHNMPYDESEASGLGEFELLPPPTSGTALPKQTSPYNIPYYNSVTKPVNNNHNDLLMQKLNYMIHLLEEQQDDRTATVTEEVVLYCFLGIFIIFLVDSFVRVGKYVR